MDHFKNICQFLWQTRSGYLIFTIVVALSVILLVAITFTNGNTPWWNWLEPLTGTTTLAVAIAVWLGELKQDWENALPKRLTVSFFYRDQEYMRCEKAYLAGEADIRAWGQQLGLQMAGSKMLSLNPSIEQSPGIIVVDENTNQKIKLFVVKFYLNSLPEGLSKGKICLWKYSFEKGMFGEKLWQSLDTRGSDSPCEMSS
jgi:hypothetical protein